MGPGFRRDDEYLEVKQVLLGVAIATMLSEISNAIAPRLTCRRPDMLMEVSPDGWLSWPGGRVRAALGQGGVSRQKREGDGRTPAGVFPLRRVLYRADRLPAPSTMLACAIIRPESGWSDDPDDPAYNTLVTLPHPWRHEKLWRDDAVYDVIAPLGYNDDPIEPGLGSAIFLHVAWPDYRPTAGCVALSQRDLLAVLRDCGGDARLIVRGP
jgi:L,D-peptidoglycan transpeptidase YkuD (ErfK/YbiS/YcfS/YnhG family)